MTWIASLPQDLRYAVRQLKQSPGFATVAVLSLALGIGANTAIFQLVDAVRLRTLPVRDPQELAYIDFAPNSNRSGWFSTRSARMTSGHWEQIRAQQQGFQDAMAWSATRFNLTPGGEARYAEGLFVSGGFFRTLGVGAAMGRTFTDGDDSAECPSAAVISHAFWQREMGGDPGVLSRTLALDGQPFPIVGVTQETFFGVEVGNRYDVAVPLCADVTMDEKKKGRRSLATAWWLSMMGRLKPGWTLERATAQLQAVSPAIMKATLPSEYRPDNAKKYLANKLEATAGGTGVSGLRRQFEQPLWLLLATTGLVLVIACANLANLLLARASTREREVAVRLAIGASRGRLIRQFLSESLLLAVLGAALGCLLAQTLSAALVAFLTTQNNALFVGLGIDWRVLGFTAGLAALTCMLFGLLPAVRATNLAPTAALRGSGRGTTQGRERTGLRRMLVATQVALSLVLLVGALLFVRSLRNLTNVDAGFRPEGLLAVSLDLRRPQYTPERLTGVHRELEERLSGRAGVISAGETLFTPVSGSGWNNDVGIDGAPAEASGKNTWFNRASPGYFRTMGTPVVAGRDFNERDTLASPKVAIVNKEFERQHMNGVNAVGHIFRREAPAGEAEEVYEIVGVVGNMKYHQLREEARPVAFLPIAQDKEPRNEATFVVRAAGSPTGLMSSLTGAVAEVNPAIGIRFRVLTRQLEESLMRERLMATLSGAFGLLAGLLSTLGLYGVISYMVARRRNEIGVRVALGADRGGVIRLVLREAVLLLSVGLAIGTGIALWVGQAASAMLYGVEPRDPVSLAGAAALLAGVAVAASYGPARRAASVDPTTALREE